MIALLLQAPNLDLSPIPSGLFRRIGGYMPFVARLSEVKPDAVTKVPEDGLRFGTVTGAGKRYGIVAIPATYLVDGDTGRILAAGAGARGSKLGPTIERALLAKKRA